MLALATTCLLTNVVPLAPVSNRVGTGSDEELLLVEMQHVRYEVSMSLAIASVYVSIYICDFMYVYVHTHICKCVRIYLCMCVCIYTSIYICMYSKYVYVMFIFVYTYIDAFLYICVFMHLCIFNYILMDIQACIIVVSFGNDIIHDFNRSCAQVGQVEVGFYSMLSSLK